jgi:hypothetical protein
MRRADRRSLASPILKGCGLLAVLVLIWCAGAVPVQAAGCTIAQDTIITYYSNAAHTTIVGSCEVGLCPGGCTGKATAYSSSKGGIFCRICLG